MILREVRELFASGRNISIPEAAEILGCDRSVVEQAFEFWLQKGSLVKVEYRPAACSGSCACCSAGSGCGMSLYAGLYRWKG